MNAETKIESGVPQVYSCIAGVQGELAKVGIAKNRQNTQGSGYMFRGIDDVYAALSPLLARHGLIVIPRVTHREVVERQSQKGNALFYVTVHAEFDFVSALDGSKHTAATFGEAMDSGDKATNKAMSAAYKYAAFMTFAIPTEGDNDADATTHEVVREKVPGIHKIKERLRTLLADGGAATKLEDFNELVSQHKSDLQTIKDANHEWWTGDGEDFEGFKAFIKRRREELAPHEDSLAFQLLVSTLNECTSGNEYREWLAKNGEVIEGLDGAEGRRFEQIHEERVAALELVDTASI
jgi:hypothetical protein